MNAEPTSTPVVEYSNDGHIFPVACPGCWGTTDVEDIGEVVRGYYLVRVKNQYVLMSSGGEFDDAVLFLDSPPLLEPLSSDELDEKHEKVLAHDPEDAVSKAYFDDWQEWNTQASEATLDLFRVELQVAVPLTIIADFVKACEDLGFDGPYGNLHLWLYDRMGRVYHQYKNQHLGEEVTS